MCMLQVIAQLKVLMRPDVTGGQFDKERWTKELKPVLDLWDKLNQVLPFIHVAILSQ